MNLLRSLAVAVTASLFAFGCTDVNLPADGTLDGITVSGTGKVTASPDIARVQVGVQTFNEELAAAVSANNEQAQAIIAALASAGVEKRDMRTANFTIAERRDYRVEGQNQVIGYDVTNTVAVTMRDLERVGDILQAAINAGANSVYSLQFAIDDAESFKTQAREKAIQDSQTRAQTMADAAGVTLGPAIRIVETTAGTVAPRTNYDAAEADKSVPIESGELEVTVAVSVVYEII